MFRFFLSISALLVFFSTNVQGQESFVSIQDFNGGNGGYVKLNAAGEVVCTKTDYEGDVAVLHMITFYI